MQPKRCGKCKACLVVERVRTSVLRCCNPPFSHADDDVVKVWNATLAENPCESPILPSAFLPSATNFADIPVREKPDFMGEVVECPKCHGHGHWNLNLDAYGIGRHFQQLCGQCNGHGWVKKGSADETCIHEWIEDKCTNRGEHWGHCTKCEKKRYYDSSD